MIHVMHNSSHTGWHSRGYLPHLDKPFHIQTINFRSADSLPAKVLKKLEQDFPKGNESGKRKRIEEYLNSGYGACHLVKPKIARVIEEMLVKFDGERYRLIAWVIMPNHVHAIIEIIEGYSLKKIMHSWKSYTANVANKILGRSGKFWYREYFDRYVRDADHLENAIKYVRWNPVKAGLVKEPEDWRFSSARF